jgi:hypothetical protein
MKPDTVKIVRSTCQDLQTSGPLGQISRRKLLADQSAHSVLKQLNESARLRRMRFPVATNEDIVT